VTNFILYRKAKEFRKRHLTEDIATEETDEQDFDEPLSPSVVLPNDIDPPPSKKSKIEKEKRFRWNNDMAGELIRCLSEQVSLRI